ncbi:MAG: choice-of-anchor W domain-containing protein [Bryobacterales bacterium]|nr:choice-of-anchor W domain-containing protein [Bryobacterales bacterium]
MKRIGLAVLLAATCPNGRSSCRPIAVQLPTANLGIALGTFDTVAFNGQVRWESSGTSNYKLRLANGSLGSPGLVTGGSPITWNSNAPQTFSMSFGGTTAALSVVDGPSTYTINANPANTAVNGLLIGIRTNGSSSITLSDLRVDGVSLNIGSISLAKVSSQSFLYVSNVFAPFTLSGLIQMARTGGGSGAEVPAMQIYAGYAEVPEPATFAMVGFLLLALAMGWRKFELGSARVVIRRERDRC